MAVSQEYINNTKNPTSIANIGDTVVYTGIIKSVINKNTKNLLRTFFKPGQECIVQDIGTTEQGVYFYRFEDYANQYPCESFTKSKKEILSILYGLK